MGRRILSDLAKNVLLAAVYFSTGKLGLRLAFFNASASAVWPPTGIALAALLLMGYRVLPGIWLGAFLVNLTTAGTALTSIGIAGGNTLEVFLGAWLVNRFAHGRHAFDRAADIFRFILLAAILSTTASATMGVTSLALGGFVRPDSYASVWQTWWLGDMVSALIVTPLIVTWSTLPATRWTRGKTLEYALILTVVATASLLGFTGLFATEMARLFPRFLFFPLLMWAAYRFGPRGAVTAAFVLSCTAIWGTVHGFGPFASSDHNDSLLLLQTFVATITVTNLVLGAVVFERQRVEEGLHESQERMHIAQQTTRWGVFDYSYVTGKNRWSPELEGLYGLRPGEFDGTHEGWRKHLHPDDRERVEQEMMHASKTGEYSHDFRVVWPDGSVHWLFARGKIFLGADGRPLRMLGVNVDITERKQAQQTQARLAAIVESSGDPIISKTLDGIVTSWNKAAETLFGYSSAEMIGQSILRLIPSDRQAEESRILADLRAGRRIEHFETVRVTKDGRLLPVSLTISPIRDNSGRIIGASKILRDITDRKNAEEVVRESQTRLAGLITSAMDAIIAVDDQQRIVLFNPAAERMFKCEAAQAIGSSIDRFIPSRFHQAHRGHIKNFGETGATSRRMGALGAISGARADGKEFPVEASISHMEAGGRKLFTVILRDITERKLAEEALRESETRFREMAESAPVMVWMAGTDKQCNYFNKPWLEFTGRSLDQEMGEGWAQGVHPDDLQPCLETYVSSFDARREFEMEYRLKRHDGEYRWILDHGVPRFAAADRFVGYIGSCIDITERKLAEQSIQKMNELLEDRVAERTAELARAYELLQAEIVERKQLEVEIARAVEREQLRMGHKLHEGLGQELTGIGYLMAALQAKLNKGSRTRSREAKKLQTMLMQSIEQTRNLAREFYPIELEQHGLLVALEGIIKTPGQASDTLYVVESDGNPAYAEFKGPSAIQLFRIAQEAVHNALTHAKAKTIIVRLATVNSHLILTVQDDGAGLSPDADRSPGMGFRIMRYRAGMVGGKLDVSSKPNAGLLVTFSVPDRQWLAPALRQPGERTEHQTSPTSNSPLV